MRKYFGKYIIHSNLDSNTINIISNDKITEIDLTKYNLSSLNINTLVRGKIVIKNGIAYKYDFENGEIKESKVNNKKATNIYELNGKFYVPKKGFTESKELDGFQDMIFLEKTGFHLKKEPPKQLYLNNILPEELEKYLEEVTF